MATERFEFEDFELDRRTYELRRAGSIVHLERIPLDLLFLLIERRGQLVTRQEIFERIWGKNVFLDVDNSINIAVRKLRRALNDEPDAPRFVVTVPARGYRFVAPIHEHGSTSPVPESSPVSPALEVSVSPAAETAETRPTVITKVAEAPQRYRWKGALLIVGTAFAFGLIVLVQHLSLRPSPTSASIHPPQTPGLPLPDKPSIAVLPFTNIGGDPAQEYFSDGITNDLTTALSRLPGIFVIDRNSAFTYKGKAVKVQQVSRELGVKYVLEGGVQKSVDEVRVTAQLVDATSGAELWADRYDRPLRDIFALQDDVVRRIVTTLNLQVTLWERGILIPKETANLEAYDDELRGVEYIQTFTKDDAEKARQMFEKAIALDPNYAGAYANLSNIYFWAWFWQWSDDPRALDRALQVGRRAIALDDSMAFAHMVLSKVYLFKKQYELAISEAQRAIMLDRNSAFGYKALATVMIFSDRQPEAVAAAERGMRLDPRNRDWYLFYEGFAYTYMGRYEEAIPLLSLHLTVYPNNLDAHIGLIIDYIELGREQEARAKRPRFYGSTPGSLFRYGGGRRRRNLWR